MVGTSFWHLFHVMCIFLLLWIIRLVSQYHRALLVPNDALNFCQISYHNGEILYSWGCFISLWNFVQPVIIPQYLNHILTLLPNMNVSALIRLANLFDPSHSTIQPLLIKAHTSRPRYVHFDMLSCRLHINTVANTTACLCKPNVTETWEAKWRQVVEWHVPRLLPVVC